MNLCIDIGNSSTKIGVFDEDELIFTDRFKSKPESYVKWLVTEYGLNQGIVSSTKKTMTKFERLVKNHLSVIKLNHLTPLPFVNTYETPKTLGKDRLAAVAACLRLFPNQNCIVIDAGTCITFDVITADGQFLGGNISPGLEMRAKAMDKFTSSLPLVNLAYYNSPIGKNTTMAMQNGIMYGAIWEIEAFIAWCRESYTDLNVIITGGDANFFVDKVNSKIFAHQNLVLIGLDVILDYNAE